MLFFMIRLMLQPGAGELLAVLARHPHELQLQRRVLRAAASRLRSSTGTSSSSTSDNSATASQQQQQQQQQNDSHNSGGDAPLSDVAADVTADTVSSCTLITMHTLLSCTDCAQHNAVTPDDGSHTVCVLLL
jgi:hypothetical protein